MPANYVLLRKTTLTSSATSVTFSNIPQSGYTDLKIVMSTRDARSGVDVSDILFNFNSTGVGNGITGRYLYGTGSSVTTATTLDGLAFGGSAANTSNTFGNSEVYISNYLSTNSYKSISSDSVSENNAAGAFQLILAGLWSSNSAIHTISMTPYASPFSADSEFSLYGLAAVGTTPEIAPSATGGDTVTTDGTYWIHTFLSSGTFTPSKTLTCDALVVAGGGGGGYEYGGGGGAGGFRTLTAGSLTVQPYTITVGAGGLGGGRGYTNGYSANSTSGNNSTFSTITSSGGGRAGSRTIDINASSGGSGGGGAASTSGAGAAGNAGGYSPVEGYAGANGQGSNVGGGGGGAGAAATSINGATGATSSITGSSVTYAGGGGAGRSTGTAGTGGAGGGGAGATGNAASGTAGTAGTGGGGGGAGEWTGTVFTGGNGGSGIVVIRYPIA